jgi:hypothetical protein
MPGLVQRPGIGRPGQSAISWMRRRIGQLGSVGIGLPMTRDVDGHQTRRRMVSGRVRFLVVTGNLPPNSAERFSFSWRWGECREIAGGGKSRADAVTGVAGPVGGR